MIIDRYLELNPEYSYIAQEFEETIYQKLVELLPVIRKYKKTVLFFIEVSDYPIGIRNAYQKFLSDYDIEGRIEKKYKPGSVKKGTLYFFISDTYLWEVLRDCRNNEYRIGKEVGILSHNDHVVKEIVFGGITTISTDFKDMAKRAATHIKEQKVTREFVPMNLIKRHSL